MSLIRVDGDQFYIENHRGKKRRPYVMATSFSLLGWYQSGRRDVAYEWLKRIKALGFDGPRVFGENQDWFLGGGGPFFGNPFWTEPVHLVGSENTGSSFLKIRDGYRDGVFVPFIEDLERLDMVSEYCAVATVKGRDESLTGNLLNKVSQMAREVVGDPNKSPLLFETVNEVDAHSGVSEAEAARFCSRWRRPGDETHHNYPGSFVGQSCGGEDWPHIPTTGATHINIHPKRGSGWILTNFADMVSHQDRRGRPIALNETIHVMSQEQWDRWTPLMPTWANLSTTNFNAAIGYLQIAYEQGISVTAHYLDGMSSNPEAPITDYERGIATWLGGSVIPPPPQPDTKIEYRHIVTNAYMDILMRAPDPEGLEEFNRHMKEGMSESQVRNLLLLSDEFKERFLG